MDSETGEIVSNTEKRDSKPLTLTGILSEVEEALLLFRETKAKINKSKNMKMSHLDLLNYLLSFANSNDISEKPRDSVPHNNYNYDANTTTYSPSLNQTNMRDRKHFFAPFH